MSRGHTRTDATFTTGEIARRLNVAPRSVNKWCDRGALPCFRLPGSLDRRVRREDLVTFLVAHRMPLGDLGPCDRPCVLAVGVGPRDADRIAAALGDAADLVAAPDPFAAGMLLRDRRPRVVLIDDALGVVAARQAAAAARADGDDPPGVVALVGEDYPIAVAGQPHGVQAAYQHPLDPAAVAAGVRWLLDRPPPVPAARRRGSKRKAGD